jgi:outer membrane protein assembly factor BamE (lipoprotein component of BamABCDE complex)
MRRDAGFGDGLHMVRFNRNAALLGALALVSGCSSIVQHHGYITEPVLMQSVHAGVDNQQSVEQLLGEPSFKSQFAQPTWYYVGNFTKQTPFGTPRINKDTVLAVSFDAAGNVALAETTGMEKVVRIHPDSHVTPTLGRERSFLEDLFGNIGQVGAAGTSGGGPPSNTGGGS